MCARFHSMASLVDFCGLALIVSCTSSQSAAYSPSFGSNFLRHLDSLVDILFQCFLVYALHSPVSFPVSMVDAIEPIYLLLQVSMTPITSFSVGKWILWNLQELNPVPHLVPRSMHLLLDCTPQLTLDWKQTISLVAFSKNPHRHVVDFERQCVSPRDRRGGFLQHDSWAAQLLCICKPCCLFYWYRCLLLAVGDVLWSGVVCGFRGCM